MKCKTHNAEANAVCVYCGRALCPDCARPTNSARTACSETCATALAKADAAVELIINKSVQSARAGALTCYLLGGIFIACGVLAVFMMPSPFLIAFLGISGVGMLIGGLFYGRAAKKQTPAA